MEENERKEVARKTEAREQGHATASSVTRSLSADYRRAKGKASKGGVSFSWHVYRDTAGGAGMG